MLATTTRNRRAPGTVATMAQQVRSCEFCNRVPTLIQCTLCNWARGNMRVQLKCVEHPNIVWMNDLGKCPDCRKSEGLMEMGNPTKVDSARPAGTVSATRPAGTVNAARPAVAVSAAKPAVEKVNILLEAVSGRNVKVSTPKKETPDRKEVPEETPDRKEVPEETPNWNWKVPKNETPEEEEVAKKVAPNRKEAAIKELSFFSACQGCGYFYSYYDMPDDPRQVECKNKFCYSRSQFKFYDSEGELQEKI